MPERQGVPRQGEGGTCPDVLRRGENAHAKHAVPKNQSPEDYSRATGLEALMGYLYLTGQIDRLLQLIKDGIRLAGMEL